MAEQLVETGYFHARRIGHVNFYVRDLNETMDFYTKVLGIEEVYRTPLAGGGFVSNGNTHHDLGFISAFGSVGKARSAKPGDMNHFAFELETELDLVASYERALRDGYEFAATVDHDISHSVYNHDPEGNRYELYADVVKDWRRQRSGTITKPKPVWRPGSTEPVSVPCYHEKPEIRRVEDALFHPLCTTHVTLVVEDLERAITHYTTLVGLRVLSRGADGSIAVLAGLCGEASLILIRSSSNRPAGYHHVGVKVASPAEFEQSVTRARAEGMPLAVDITDRGRRAVFVRDPDGFLVQLYADSERLDMSSLTADFALYLL